MRFVQRCLQGHKSVNNEQKAVRVTMCQALLAQYSQETDDFIEKIKT